MELDDLLKKDIMEAVTKNLTSIQVQTIQQILAENDKLKIENEEQKKMDCQQRERNQRVSEIA